MKQDRGMGRGEKRGLRSETDSAPGRRGESKSSQVGQSPPLKEEEEGRGYLRAGAREGVRR